jgi:hypothetical protein
MAHELGFPVFDGDNHLYETRAALTADFFRHANPEGKSRLMRVAA